MRATVLSIGIRVGAVALGIISSLDRIAASASSLTVASEEGSGLERLPLEIRDHIFARLDVYEYAQFLKAAGSAAEGTASSHLLHQMIRNGAAELRMLDFAVFGQRDRIKQILSGVQTVVRVQFTRLLASAGREWDLTEMAGLFEESFAECAEHSSTDLWRGACMSALVDNTIQRERHLLSRLSAPFIKAHVGLILFAVITAGDWEAFDLLKPYWETRSRRGFRGILFGIGFGGSRALQSQVVTRIPRVAKSLLSVLIAAALFGRETFFLQLLLDVTVDEREGEEAWKKLVWGAFAVACGSGSATLVERLARHFGDILTAKCLEAGLIKAVRGGNLPVVKFILSHDRQRPADRQLRPSLFSQIMIDSARLGRLNVLEYLLLDWEDERRLGLRWYIPGAMARAIAAAPLAVLDVLLGTDRTGEPLISYPKICTEIIGRAVASDRVEAIEYLLARKATDSRFAHFNLAACNNAWLYYACEDGAQRIFQFLMQQDERRNFIFRGIDPGAGNNAPLRRACARGHLAMVQELLRTDADNRLVHQTVQPASLDNESLRMAAIGGHLEIVKLLLERVERDDGKQHYKYEGIDPSARGQAALGGAALNKHVAVVAVLLQQDADGTPLYPEVAVPNDLLVVVAQRGHRQLVRLLLQGPFVGDRAQAIALALAAAQQHRRHHVVDLLGLHLHPHPHPHPPPHRQREERRWTGKGPEP